MTTPCGSLADGAQEQLSHAAVAAASQIEHGGLVSGVQQGGHQRTLASLDRGLGGTGRHAESCVPWVSICLHQALSCLS